MSYGRFAQVYDELMSDVPYDQWVSFTKNRLRESSIAVKNIADLGAGTGEITLRLDEEGFNMTGIDVSEEMLTIAHQKSLQSQSTIQWLQMDITNLNTSATYDAVVCFCDVVNYLTDIHQVEAFMNNAYQLLAPGGKLIFDVHSTGYVQDFLANQTFGAVTDDISYIWFCEEGLTPYTVSHDLTFFVREGNKYERFDEVHHQRTFSVETYVESVQEAGFQLCSVHGDFSDEEGFDEKEHDRIFFVCEKPLNKEEA
ncbi:class I SAM-dependent DNA methyltransferase [Pontibacillus yanchengensis]|uniref:Methyltransferase n=1 Tax=Pontibacillus yanchengensis Y32 TaxID=1385514 RepID=A0A0A2TG90_9BACI|nr:class I SAM-dependent methyltransferase [Pontibacillus yanchengensis]KGP73131.1 methyltransferase [Pontibacillus yanchengensis Y32]